MQKRRVTVISGPTASGKTGAAIELAKRINGEIISADSMQIYKYMNIGTAKPCKEEMKGIVHHMVDCVEPDEEFSVAQYQKKALEKIRFVIKKGKTPIVAGGTGLYLNSVIYNYDFSDSSADYSYREYLDKIAREKGKEYLHKMLKIIDENAAEKIHPNNVKRVIRALEINKHTKKNIDKVKEESLINNPEFNFDVFILSPKRDMLYDNINRRVEIMLNDGLIYEVENLLKMGYASSLVSMQAIGYKEVIWYIKGLSTYNEMVYLLKKNTRNYAKRQITWLKKIKGAIWLNIDPKEYIEYIMEKYKKKC